MATMVQVAEMAGVSISTVSHVLNGTRHVEPETKQRVLDAISRTGYRQDALARALRRSRTDSIGLVVPDAGEPAFAEMVHGVEHAAANLGLTLILANSAENPEREERATHALLDRRVDGLILGRAAVSTPGLLQLLEEEKTPIVLLDRVFPDLPFDQVGADNREPMERLVAHLIAAGHRRFALMAGDIRVPTLRERGEGFGNAIRAAGLDPADQIVLSGTDDDELKDRLLDAFRAPARPTAVIAGSTPLAVSALRTARTAGLTIPGEVAFAAFDGFNHSDLFEPQITTVRQPAFDVGVAAVRLLADRLHDGDARPRTVRLQQSIEFRASTEDFPGVDADRVADAVAEPA
ncbi:LacI family DNA-binding transcriptional regulator [Naasia aerilata]|uniref:LacI family transcriptional regulator n=1 Tax=Naasia aerilata TaxID=1162966 RepID=A0ABM8GD43_9MICO|nr:LacI family DNA-binding transcriptional regulator [Naasia aerilata]BDZ46152.1 LacI family transcriptional regulator [Naasia aerilata]